MRIFHNRTDPFIYDSVCALGNFDGIHRGHMEIIERLKKLRSKNRKIGIITFNPSPVSFLHKNEIFFLTTTAEKERILDAIEIDFIFYFKFDNEFAEKSPEQFVQLVYETIKPHALIVGENFHFGKGRKGSADLLDKLARGKFDVEIISTIRDQEGIISSTRIRELLLLGNIPGANRILGRNYALSGKVIKGKGKGTTLGFPTINLSVEKEKLLPLDGVYEVKLVIDNTPYKGAMFLSHNNIEVHILDFSGNLYDQEITVELIRRIRSIKKFPDDNLLKKAISEDIDKISHSKI